MRIPGAVRPALIGLALLSPAWIVDAQPDRDEAAVIIGRVGERVLEYYQRAQRLMCLERSTVLPIDARWNPQGMARTVDSELRMSQPPDGSEVDHQRGPVPLSAAAHGRECVLVALAGQQEAKRLG